MEHIIVNIEPFSYQQSILVYKNGECIRQASAIINDLIPTIKAIAEEYNINTIDLCGNLDYLKKFKQDLEKPTEYNNNYKVNIIKL